MQFLSDGGPALDSGSGSFYSEANFRSESPGCSRCLSLGYRAKAHKQAGCLLGTNKYQLLL